MNIRKTFWPQLAIACLAALPLTIGLSVQAQTTTPGVTVEVLGIGTGALLLSPLTDPENDGLDALGGATDPSWNWKNITASVEPDFEGGENSFNIFDHKVGGGNDKWCCDDPTPGNPVWVDVEFAKSVSLTHFTVTSGNDTPDRDPVDWAIQGSNDGTAYTDIYHFIDTPALWTDRNQVLKFTLPTKSAPYTHIRYIAYDTPGSLHQLNEVEYFGGPGVVAVDTDKDGIPDDWELKYGLNPNDATDAAKDLNKNGISNLDEFKLGFDPTDTVQPTIVSAKTSGTFDTIVLNFSKKLDEASAGAASNYVIAPSLVISAVAVKGSTVTLTTAKQTPGGAAYTVTVNNVLSDNKLKIANNSKVIFYSYLLTRTGLLRFAYWGGIGGTPVQGLLDDPRYPASPDLVAPVLSFDSRGAFPDDSHESYGATIEGFLTPTEPGNYRFFSRSDDASQLFLSTDDTEAKLAQIAEETGCCKGFNEPDHPTTSEPIALVAGKKYFVRLIYKEGGGGDYGQVAWRKEGDKTPAGSLKPIPGKFLSAATDIPFPSDGIFLTQSPAPNAKNVGPDAQITLVHVDGKTAWTAANIALKLDGAAVTPAFSKAENSATVSYTPPSIFGAKSVHTLELTYPLPDGTSASTVWSFTVTDFRNIILPQPIYFEDFEKFALGGAPTGWTLTNNTDSLNATLDIGDPKSDTYLDWLILDGNQVYVNGTNGINVWEANDPDGRVSHIAPGQVVNGTVLKAADLMVGKFLYAESDERGSSQEQTAISPNIDLTGKTNIWLSFHSSYMQNQDSIGVVEYSIDGGAKWLPVLYMLDGPDIARTNNAVDAVTTFTRDQTDTAHAQPYGNFVGAPISQDLAPFISARVNDDSVESHRVELFPLPKADNQSKVKLRFLQAGTGSWYFGIDNVGIYSIPAATPAAPKISVVRNANKSLTITFEGSVETAPTINGPWTKSPATSPATITPDQAAAYARARR